MQKIGLKYVEHINKKMTRKDAEKIFNFVKKCLQWMVGSKQFKNFTIEACGSYRRGKETCGDVDILISRKDKDVNPDLLDNLIKVLEE